MEKTLENLSIFSASLILSIIINPWVSADEQGYDAIQSLFKPMPSLTKPTSARNTFVFLINGDEESFRGASNGKNTDLIKIDSVDVNKIRQFSEGCECNTVILHDQRLSRKWLVRDKYEDVFLWVYQRGQLQKFPDGHFFSTVREINLADPGSIFALLMFSEKIFPDSDLHFIYRGHSFGMAYNSKVKTPKTLPFDYSHPSFSYGIPKFVSSIKRFRKQSGRQLKSITFASCSMAYVSLAFGLTGLADFLLASQVNIVESGTSGFSFSFLPMVADHHTSEDIVSIISNHLLYNFVTTPQRTEFMHESPLSVINLNRLLAGKDLWGKLRGTLSSFESLEILEPLKSLGALTEEPKLEEFRVKPNYSNRYLNLLKRQGISDASIKVMKKSLLKPYIGDESIDFLSYLQAFNSTKSLADKDDRARILDCDNGNNRCDHYKQVGNQRRARAVQELESILKSALSTVDQASLSSLQGLSFLADNQIQSAYVFKNRVLVLRESKGQSHVNVEGSRIEHGTDHSFGQSQTLTISPKPPLDLLTD